MAVVSFSADPGDMTVPFLAGWELVAVSLVLVVVLVAAVSVISAARAGRSGRAEWQAWLDGRSVRADDPSPEPGDRSAEPAH